jgi:hypothetical protein
MSSFAQHSLKNAEIQEVVAAWMTVIRALSAVLAIS